MCHAPVALDVTAAALDMGLYREQNSIGKNQYEAAKTPPLTE